MRREGKWIFRRGFGPKEFFIRAVALVGLFFLAYFSNPRTPTGREDKEWLESFSLVMIAWFAVLESMAYLPSMMFGSFADMCGVVRGRVSHAMSEWRDYQYCAALVVGAVILYPIIIFFYLIYDGFNPYSELTHAELRIEGGLQSDMVYMFRVILHLFLLVSTCYMLLMLILK